MLSMSHINNIRDLRKKGSTIKEIAEITHTDPKTVRKYLNQEDFSPQRPVNPERPSILDPFKPIIQKWLDEDKKNWRKQQFTAMRIYHLLQEQKGFTGSYNVVQRYVKKVKKREKERRNLELISAWAIASRMKSRKRNCSRDSMPSTISYADSVLPGQDMKKGTSRTRSAISTITCSSRSPNSMIGMNSTDNCCSPTRRKRLKSITGSRNSFRTCSRKTWMPAIPCRPILLMSAVMSCVKRMVMGKSASMENIGTRPGRNWQSNRF